MMLIYSDSIGIDHLLINGEKVHDNDRIDSAMAYLKQHGPDDEWEDGKYCVQQIGQQS